MPGCNNYLFLNQLNAVISKSPNHHGSLRNENCFHLSSYDYLLHFDSLCKLISEGRDGTCANNVAHLRHVASEVREFKGQESEGVSGLPGRLHAICTLCVLHPEAQAQKRGGVKRLVKPAGWLEAYMGRGFSSTSGRFAGLRRCGLGAT